MENEEVKVEEAVAAASAEATAAAPTQDANQGGFRGNDRRGGGSFGGNRGQGGGDRRGGGDRPGGGGRGPRREREDTKVDDGIKTKMVQLRRVSKTVKGGRNMRFSAIVVAGDGNGSVGCGMGKATEVPEAIRKAEMAARKNMTRIALGEHTIPHEVIGLFSASKVYLRPAPEGTGIIAGGSVRAVLDLAGVKNITSKSYGSRNAANTVKATIEGLYSLRSPEHIARLRGKSVEEIL